MDAAPEFLPSGRPPQVDTFASLENSVGFHLRQAHEAILLAVRKRLDAVDLPAGRIAVIRLIAERPGITPGEITVLTRRDKSTLTPILLDLERRHYVLRVPSKADRRSYGLKLTELGLEVAAQLQDVVRETERQIAELLGQQEREILLAQLKLLSEKLPP